MNFIPGKTYDPAHLRQPPWNWEEFVDAGHPLATAEGKAIRHLRVMLKDDVATVYGYDIWNDERVEWESSTTGIVNVHGILDHVRVRLRLAPIAVKDGKPLHLGDFVQLRDTDSGNWLFTIQLNRDFYTARRILSGNDWRWPVEEK